MTLVSTPVPAWRQYLYLLGAAWKSQLQYRSNALWTIPFNQLTSMDWPVQHGAFDRYLIRPIGVLTQHLTSRANFQSVGDLVGGAGVLATAGAIAAINWSPASVLYLLAAVLGGAMVECSLQLFLCAFAFRLLSKSALRLNFIDSIMNNFGGYPITIFPAAMRFALTFVLPLAFVAYLPASVLLDRTHQLFVPPWLAVTAPALGPILFALAYKFWYSQLKHYKSTGI